MCKVALLVQVRFCDGDENLWVAHAHNPLATVQTHAHHAQTLLVLPATQDRSVTSCAAVKMGRRGCVTHVSLNLYQFMASVFSSRVKCETIPPHRMWMR